VSNICGNCGADPAKGYATIGETRYCHEGESPTCYERTQCTHSTLHRVLGEYVDDPLVMGWVRDFQLFMHQREIWRPTKDAPFWDRLGMHGDLAEHLPIGVNEQGQGPVEPEPAHHYECWCSDPECPLTMALQHAWFAGRRSVE
jgi:hypothetical protein